MTALVDGVIQSKHPLWSMYHGIRARCLNAANKAFGNYGGRGITVCERWESFAAFVEDMGPRPDGYTIDRINNNGNYEPSNCRWATRKEQRHNQRPKQAPRGAAHPRAKLVDSDVRMIRFLGALRVWPQREVAKQFGVSASTIAMITTGRNWRSLR